MELREWQGTVAYINDEIRRILEGQRVLREVHDQLAARDAAPLEEDFIDADLDDVPVGVPRIREVDGILITSRKLHRRGHGARDIEGADMLYEIENHKYVLIQYKTPDARGRVLTDREQLAALVASCPANCVPAIVWPYCGSWHCVRSTAGGFTIQRALQLECSMERNHAEWPHSLKVYRSRHLMSYSLDARSVAALPQPTLRRLLRTL